MSSNELFSVGLGEKIADVFKTLKSFEIKEKGKPPYGLVFHPNTLSKLIIECEKKNPAPARPDSFVNFCMGINVYSGEKVPEHVVKVAYSQQEVAEILEFGITLAEKQKIEDYFRNELHSEKIICPECGTIQDATVQHTTPWWTYFHFCTNCEYAIMESEWVKESEAGC